MDLEVKDIVVIAVIVLVTWLLTTWWVALGTLALATLFNWSERQIVKRVQRYVSNRHHDGNHA